MSFPMKRVWQIFSPHIQTSKKDTRPYRKAQGEDDLATKRVSPKRSGLFLHPSPRRLFSKTQKTKPLLVVNEASNGAVSFFMILTRSLI